MAGLLGVVSNAFALTRMVLIILQRFPRFFSRFRCKNFAAVNQRLVFVDYLGARGLIDACFRCFSTDFDTFCRLRMGKS